MFISRLYVSPSCMSMFMLHVHVRARRPCLGCMSMAGLHVNVLVACLFPCFISMSRQHIYVQAASLCCMNMLYGHGHMNMDTETWTWTWTPGMGMDIRLKTTSRNEACTGCNCNCKIEDKILTKFFFFVLENGLVALHWYRSRHSATTTYQNLALRYHYIPELGTPLPLHTGTWHPATAKHRTWTIFGKEEKKWWYWCQRANIRHESVARK